MFIETFDLRKTYPSPGWLLPSGWSRAAIPALSGVSLKLSPGTITGLAGPNGAGKSTLLRILSGRLIPDTGHVLLNGRETDDTALRAEASLVEAGARSFYPRLSALENLDFFGTLYGLSRAETQARTEPLRKAFSIRDGDLNRRFDSLSEGTAQKFSLLRALIRRAPILLLDEPARNLDIRSAAAFSVLIKDLATEAGVTVLYASHDPAELAGICGRLLALKDGNLAAETGSGTPAGMEAAAAKACAGTP